ncbi:MAG: hypothetical protein UT37_C0004G0003 [Parcubacteria group bacterium GW2011_GWA2_39_18]|nr:MAG: hypothetical protein UT37_C0004G0003 [Parcubacteria group bacterium GW2011_GWA2_39_18]
MKFNDAPNPEIEQKVVSRNMELMETEMSKLASEESMGGNAGRETIGGKKYSCVGLNGYADQRTGMILVFGNF